MDQQTIDPDLLNVLVLERVDRTKNMARYYVLSVEPTLFAEWSLVRRWGRTGGAGRTRWRNATVAPIAALPQRGDGSVFCMRRQGRRKLCSENPYQKIQLGVNGAPAISLLEIA